MHEATQPSHVTHSSYNFLTVSGIPIDIQLLEHEDRGVLVGALRSAGPGSWVFF